MIICDTAAGVAHPTGAAFDATNRIDAYRLDEQYRTDNDWGDFGERIKEVA